MYDIVWDTDDCDCDLECMPSEEELGLPSEVTIQVNNHWDTAIEASEYLSDNYGYCVKSLKTKENGV
jgi:hypothetical protein